MSQDETKAAACAGGCLDGIVVDNFRELTEVAVTLAANGRLDADQLEDMTVLYTEFETEVRRRKREDREAREQLKTILRLDE